MIRLQKHKYPGNSAFCLQETGQYKKGSQNFYSTKVFLSRGSIFLSWKYINHVKMEMNQDDFLIYLNNFLFLIYVGWISELPLSISKIYFNKEFFNSFLKICDWNFCRYVLLFYKL